MNKRIEKLKETIRPEKYPVCTEKARLMTESWKETDGKTVVEREAKAVANLLEKITIFIEDGELLVGWPASKPMGFELTQMSTKWTEEEGESFKKEAHLEITEEVWAEIKSLNDYWYTRTEEYRLGALWDEERLWPLQQSGLRPPTWKSREEGPSRGSAGRGLALSGGFAIVDFEKVLNSGLKSIIEEAKEELKNLRFTSRDSVEKEYFLKAVIIAHEAIIGYANRFATLAAEMASKEDDPTRKKELERIVATCQRVPANPARDFYEAMQSYWFLFLMLADDVFPMGRFDQFMYPFYKKDIDEGRITDDEVLELLQCLRIKTMETNHTFGKEYRQKRAGFARWNNMVIGGVKPDGEDATNELSYLILEAAKRCQTPHHTITVRVHDGTPEAFMLKALELVKTGIGMPAFAGDKSNIEYLLSHGVPLKDARNYSLAGCFDVTLPCKSFIIGVSIFGVPPIFDIFLHNGIFPATGKQMGPRTGELESFETYDNFVKAFKEQLAYFTELQAEVMVIRAQVENELTPNPISSSLMDDGIKVGKNIRERVFPFQQKAGIVPAGMINVVDSLAAVKKLVFEEKKVTMKQLKAALETNWQGNEYEEMRKMFLAAPKYGNGDDYVDLIAKDLYQFFADMVEKLPAFSGGTVKPSGISVSAHGPLGAMTGATPDGRYAGEIVADGTMSPAQGRDTHGPIAVMKSASKIDQTRYQSTLLNMKFHPSALQSTEDMRKLSDLVRTYFSLGGKHVQFNVVDKETLVKAQKYPEKYRNLVVRVAGYSAYYVQLTKTIQDELIQRMEHVVM